MLVAEDGSPTPLVPVDGAEAVEAAWIVPGVEAAVSARIVRGPKAVDDARTMQDAGGGSVPDAEMDVATQIALGAEAAEAA